MSALRQRRGRRACTSFLSDFIKRECVIYGTRHALRTQNSHKASRVKGLLRSDSKSLVFIAYGRYGGTGNFTETLRTIHQAPRLTVLSDYKPVHQNTIPELAIMRHN